MNSFVHDYFFNCPITPELLKTVRLLGEYKGHETFFKQQSSPILNVLKKTAFLDSMEADRRLAGTTISAARLKGVMSANITPLSPYEQELAGYRSALDNIHNYWEVIPFTPSTLQQLHQELYQYCSEPGGYWKTTNPNISLNKNSCVSADETPDSIHQLHELFTEAWNKSLHDPLILISTYILDFLCIQPFPTGNARMARLLTILLLHKAGYHIASYISLDKITENTIHHYYNAFTESSHGWKERQHLLLPWWNYFLQIVLTSAYCEFEQKVTSLRKSGAKKEMLENIIRDLPKVFSIADLERHAIGISRPTMNRTLAKLKQDGTIKKVCVGRDALWEKI